MTRALMTEDAPQSSNEPEPVEDYAGGTPVEPNAELSAEVGAPAIEHSQDERVGTAEVEAVEVSAPPAAGSANGHRLSEADQARQSRRNRGRG